MSTAALGLVTALALSAAAAPSPQGPWQDLRFGARRQPPAQEPLFGPEPLRSGEPTIVCRTPVVHGDTQVDPRFVVPVPETPTFAMRWAPSTPCDPDREQRGRDVTPHAQPRR
jgi:hypothetical protein